MRIENTISPVSLYKMTATYSPPPEPRTFGCLESWWDQTQKQINCCCKKLKMCDCGAGGPEQDLLTLVSVTLQTFLTLLSAPWEASHGDCLVGNLAGYGKEGYRGVEKFWGI